LETLVKDDILSNMNTIKARSIMASQYYTSAIFSNVFKQIKERFKLSLNNKITYTDGSTYMDLQKLLNRYN